MVRVDLKKAKIFALVRLISVVNLATRTRNTQIINTTMKLSRSRHRVPQKR